MIYSIDNYNWNRISGWAFSEHKKKIKISFYVNKKYIGHSFACKYRTDLESIYDSKGFIAFDYEIDQKYRFKQVDIKIGDKFISPKWKLASARDSKLLKFYNNKMKSLEIGALDKPILSTKSINNVFADHTDINSLKEKYKKRLVRSIDFKNFSPVDYKLGYILNSKKKFNFEYIVASHFLEHYPNPIYFLKKISFHLKSGGILSLALPDKRYTFDKNNPSSTFNDWMTLFIENSKKPKFSSIYNSLKIKYKKLNILNFEKKAFFDGLEIHKKNEYFDCHVSYFSKNQFIDLIQKLFTLNIIDLDIIKIYPNFINAEFIVILKKN